MQAKNIVIGITGASGAIYGVRVLEILKEIGIKTHLIISKSAHIAIPHELDLKLDNIKQLADYYYNNNDIGACISSGSFRADSMIIAPCSAKTLSAIANGYDDGLIARSASVMLKERRKCVLMFRETPYTLAHIENMHKVTQMGGIIYPPVPAMYACPDKIEDMVNHTIGRVLDLFNIDNNLAYRWKSNS